MSRGYSIGLYEKAMPKSLTWKEKLEIAKELGYDFVEISIDETDEKLSRLDMDISEKDELLHLMSESGIAIRTMCLSGHRKYPLGSNDENLVKKSLSIMKKAIDLADYLGIRIIQLAGYDVYYEESNDETKLRFERNLKKAVDMASKKGVLMGFETMETEFMNTVEKSMKYVYKMDSKFLGVYPDLGNITNAAVEYKSDVCEDLKTGKGHLLAMHLKETVSGKFREIPFGTGHVDFEKGIETAWNLGVRTFVTEMWYVDNEDWKECIKFAIDKMTKILDKQIDY